MSEKSNEGTLEELYEMTQDIEIAMFTTRRPNGQLVSRPMATQKREPDADLWFVTSTETHKVDELEVEPEVNVAYYNNRTREWASVSGRVSISTDRARIRELYKPDWKLWFPKEGGERDGGPDDPRFALLFVKVDSAVYGVKTKTQAGALVEMVKSLVTGEQPDLMRVEHVGGAGGTR